MTASASSSTLDRTPSGTVETVQDVEAAVTLAVDAPPDAKEVDAAAAVIRWRTRRSRRHLSALLFVVGSVLGSTGAGSTGEGSTGEGSTGEGRTGEGSTGEGRTG